MALANYKTFVAGEVLTAADMNALQSHFTGNALTLISPLTGNLDFNGNQAIMDADGDSYLVCSSDDILTLRLQGFDGIIFDGDVSSPVNGFTFTTAATGAAPAITAHGETNVPITLASKGTGDIQLAANGFNSVIVEGNVASPVNGVTVTPAATGSSPTIAPHGETNIDLTINSTGTGDVNIGPASTGELYLNGAIHKKVVATTSTVQTNVSDTEVDLTSLTALTLPTTTSVSTKTFEVRAVFVASEQAGNPETVVIRLYSGSTGDKGDTNVAAVAHSFQGSDIATIPFVFQFSPSADANVKFGFSAQTTNAADVDFQTLSSYDSTVVCEEIDT